MDRACLAAAHRAKKKKRRKALFSIDGRGPILYPSFMPTETNPALNSAALAGETPDADWTLTPQGWTVGRTRSGAKIVLSDDYDGVVEYWIKGAKLGTDESGTVDSLDELRALIAD